MGQVDAGEREAPRTGPLVAGLFGVGFSALVSALVTSERPSEGGRRGVPATRVDDIVTHRECVELQATDVRTLHADVR